MSAPAVSIILASTSPRRIDLLTQAGLKPLVIPPDTDETELPRESPRSMVARLAREKAEAVAAHLLSGSVQGLGRDATIIIAADTTVVDPTGKHVLGKPTSEAQACKMLRTLSGKTHTVLTGYCVLKLAPPKGKRSRISTFSTHLLVRVVTSRVRMRKVSARDIQAYVRTGEPMDKAGSYGAQGIGMTLIESLSGSYSNVVGLPICQLMQDLEAKFGIGLFDKARGGAKR